MVWGLSEALDLVDKYSKYNKSDQLPREINILLFGAGDIRHVLQTIANQTQRNEIQVNFHVLQGCVNVIARDLLLLDIALSADNNVFGPLARTHLFMDIYGNAFIRPVSRLYMKSLAHKFINLITDLESMEKYSTSLDLTAGLSYRDRDQLAEIFSFLKSDQTVGLKSMWIEQLRNYLGQRYDSRKGAFDWDLHMELRYRGGERICNQEYLDFRETGLAFKFPEFEYNCENKTLVVASQSGNSYQLITDMHTGPYPSFGVHCEDDLMLESSHGENFYRATDITERNILKMIHQIRFKESPSYESLRKHKLGAARFISENILPPDEDSHHETDILNHNGLINLDNIKIKFLSPKMIKSFNAPTPFDVIFVGAGSFQYLNEAFPELLKPNGIILFETLQLSLLHKDKRAAFEDKVKEFATSAGLKLMTNFNVNKPYTTYDYRKCGGVSI